MRGAEGWNWTDLSVGLLICYGALLLGFVVGLLVTAGAAERMGVGQTLRLGED